MNTDFYKERNQRIIKARVILFVVICFIVALFCIAYYGADLGKGLVSIIVGILNCCVAINTFHRAKLKKIDPVYKAVAIVFFLGGLVWIYLGVDKILRFYN